MTHASGIVTKALRCGCDVDGWGTLPEPWTPRLCPFHEATLELLEACKAALEEANDEYVARYLELAEAAIAKAEGRKPE